MSKTGFVYKLCCNDIEIKECYVGSTNNERVRKSDHKKRCINPNQKTHNCYVYQYIRENGGFQNWDMVRLEEFKYDNKRELHTRERYWLETLKASLNKVIPTRTLKEWQVDNREEQTRRIKEKFTCECGKIYTNSNKARHEKSQRHKDYLTNHIIATENERNE